METRIAFCSSKWALPVLVDEKGDVFYVIKDTNVRLPFIPKEEYRLIDAVDLRDLASKYIFAEMKIKALTKKIEDGYDHKHLEKYFRERIVDLPEFYVVNKIVSKYTDFLDSTVMSNDKWAQRWNKIKEQMLPQIEKDAAWINLFMEFIKA